ncbi:hypothetical protein LV779_10580 [Streptomyces thinghirensis]|nr:hypothetical protein [Streptomyces thinghirensis]
MVALADDLRLGMFVVARLAPPARHHRHAALLPYGGTTAIVLIPHDVVLVREPLDAAHGPDRTGVLRPAPEGRCVRRPRGVLRDWRRPPCPGRTPAPAKRPVRPVRPGTPGPARHHRPGRVVRPLRILRILPHPGTPGPAARRVRRPTWPPSCATRRPGPAGTDRRGPHRRRRLHRQARRLVPRRFRSGTLEPGR